MTGRHHGIGITETLPAWRVGQLRADLWLGASDDGAIRVCELRVTDADGWLDLDPGAGLADGGAWGATRVQLATVRDEHDGPGLFLRAVAVAGATLTPTEFARTAGVARVLDVLAGVRATLARRVDEAGASPRVALERPRIERRGRC